MKGFTNHTLCTVALLAAGSLVACQQTTVAQRPWTPEDNWYVRAPEPYPHAMGEFNVQPRWPGNIEYRILASPPGGQAVPDASPIDWRNLPEAPTPPATAPNMRYD